MIFQHCCVKPFCNSLMRVFLVKWRWLLFGLTRQWNKLCLCIIKFNSQTNLAKTELNKNGKPHLMINIIEEISVLDKSSNRYAHNSISILPNTRPILCHLFHNTLILYSTLISDVCRNNAISRWQKHWRIIMLMKRKVSYFMATTWPTYLLFVVK